jgi:hypothetical protein
MHAYREGALAVAALEACLVVRDAVGGEEVDEVDRLVAGFALVLRAGERHGDRALRLHLPRLRPGTEDRPSG